MNLLRSLAALLAAAVLALGLGAAYADKPTLEEPAEPELRLKDHYQTGKSYSLHLVYTDADGDKIKSAKFIQTAPTSVSKDYKTIEGSDPRAGQMVVWEVNDFEKGGHSGYFEVATTTGEIVRFPEEGKSYTFTVSSVTDKWVVFVVGTLICLLAIPFLVYIVARSANRQGNPSSAARIGLLVGIFGALALFIYEFVGVYDPLILALGGLAAIAAFILVLVRR